MGSIAGLLLGSSCRACGRPGALVCGSCLPVPVAELRPVAGVDRLVVAWPYEGLARSLILDLKLRGLRGAADCLVAGMSATAARRGLGAGAITWVPARRRDIGARGFDHAELLARGLGAAMGLPVIRALARAGHQPDQAGLSRSERIGNLAGAFRGIPSDHARVVIVDDLVTTGATLAACARSLRTSGYAWIGGIAACGA